jgi:hypothetical protein
MARDIKATSPMSRGVAAIARPKVSTAVASAGEVALINVSGLVDEHFTGFGALDKGVKTLIINVAGMTRMTSFGVRQWLKAMDGLPKSISDLYLMGCPTFFAAGGGSPLFLHGIYHAGGHPGKGVRETPRQAGEGTGV